MSRLSLFEGIVDFFSFTFRTRRTINVALVVASVVPGAFFWHMPGALWRQVFLFGYVWLLGLGVWSQGGFVVRVARIAILSAVLGRKYKPLPYSTPAVNALATRMGVSGKAKVFVTRNPYVSSAYTNALTCRVFIPANWVESLPDSETLAVLAHEFAHIKRRGRFTVELSLAIGLGYAIPTIISLFTVLLLIVFWVAEMSIAFLATSFISWRNEFQADKDGAEATGPEGLISVFELLESEYGAEGSETHPPPSSRIRRLVKQLDAPSVGLD